MLMERCSDWIKDVFGHFCTLHFSFFYILINRLLF